MAHSIVVVDDSSAFIATLRAALEASSFDIVLDEVRSEADFRASLARWEARPPSVFIIDVMLRWVRPDPKAPPRPSWYMGKSRFRAGIRCAKLLLEHRRLAATPVIFYTVLDRSEVTHDLRNDNLNWPVVHKDEGFGVLFRRLDRVGITG